MATDTKPDCGCGHPFAEHDEIKTPTLSEPDLKQYVCMHVDRIGPSAIDGTYGRMGTVCGCSNYKPLMTAEQRFKNCVVEAMVMHLPNRMLMGEGSSTLDEIAAYAWEKYNQ